MFCGWTKLLAPALTIYLYASPLKGKGKVHPITGHEGSEVEWRYGSTLSLISALYGGGWSTTCPGHLSPGKKWYPLHGRLGGPQRQSGQVQKISPPLGFNPWTIQPIDASPVTVYTPHCYVHHANEILKHLIYCRYMNTFIVLRNLSMHS